MSHRNICRMSKIGISEVLSCKWIKTISAEYAQETYHGVNVKIWRLLRGTSRCMSRLALFDKGYRWGEGHLAWLMLRSSLNTLSFSSFLFDMPSWSGWPCGWIVGFVDMSSIYTDISPHLWHILRIWTVWTIGNAFAMVLISKTYLYYYKFTVCETLIIKTVCPGLVGWGTYVNVVVMYERVAGCKGFVLSPPG